MKKLELGLCVLLALGGLAHLGGTLAAYKPGTEVFVWSVAASAFVFSIVFLHVLRIQRPDDRPVAAGAMVATVVWIGIALAFGAAADGIGDPRVVTHVAISLALLGTAAVRWRSPRSSTPATSRRQ